MDQNIQIYLFTYLVNSSHLNIVLTEEWKININGNTGLSTKLFSWEISFVSCARVLILLMIYSARTQRRLLHPSLHCNIWYMTVIGHESYLRTHDLIIGAPATSFVSKCFYTHHVLLSSCIPWIFWCHGSDCVKAVSHNWAKADIWVFLCDHLKYLQQLLREQENNFSISAIQVKWYPRSRLKDLKVVLGFEFTID